MKGASKLLRTGAMALALGLILLPLAACSIPITVPIPKQTFNVPALPGIQGKIFYPKSPTTFDPPPIAPKSAEIQGTLAANKTLDTTLAFYVRLRDLKDDPNCIDLSSYSSSIQAYACTIGPDDEKAGEASFNNANATSLTLRGNNLTQGISQGKFWMGLEASGLPSGMVQFTLKDAKATVVVGF